MRAVLSPAAYRAAWEYLGLGAMPIVLYVDAGDEDVRELDPWLVDALKVIANPAVSVDVRIGFGSSKISALATGNVLAVLTRDAMTISEHDDPVDELIALLPTGDDVRAQFGAAVVDAGGRRHRAADVVDWASGDGITQEALKARIADMVDVVRSIVDK